MNPGQNKNISIIVAVAENNAIGKNNELLWHLPDDLKRFKKITSGHMVIMGRRTYLSLPGGALPNRVNVVISDVPGESFAGCKIARSVTEALDLCDDKEECFIIGGGMIYRQFLPYATRLYLTVVHKHFDADTFFPEINYDEWIEVSGEKVLMENTAYPHSFLVYERR